MAESRQFCWCSAHEACSSKSSLRRNQAEVGHTCRGSINLQGAYIHVEDSFKYIVSNGGTQTFHLKAANEVERQRWVTALELARVRAIKAAESDEEEEMKLEAEESHATEKGELQSVVRVLQAKLEDLTTCQDLIVKHGASLQKSLAELEQVAQNSNEPMGRVKAANERATLFRITTNAMINACNEFVALAQSHGTKWVRMLKHEREQRIRLQETLEQLARQHSALEHAALKEAQDHGLHINPQVLPSDDEGEFHDALEDNAMQGDETRDRRRRSHKRSGSEVSEGATGEREDSDGKDVSPDQTKDYLRAKIITRPDSSQTNAASHSLIKGLSMSEGNHEAGSGPGRRRRKSIPPRPNVSLSLWSIMKNCIGKELSKIPMPVNFNEPLSMLQRLTEDMEYSSILDAAAAVSGHAGSGSGEGSWEEMCHVAAFTISSYSTTTTRTGKPFNPLLGETYECDRLDDLGWRSIVEQVSHHPPAAAQFTEGRGWRMWQEFTMSSKFRGKYLQIIPLGISHLEFTNSGNHYTWRKVATTVHNIIVGRLWIDNHGEMSIENHKTGDKCHLKYIPYSYFSRETPRKVTGVVQDNMGEVRWVIQGTWDDHVECARVVSQQSSEKTGNGKPVFETETPRRIWTRNPPLPNCEQFYYFTELAVQLNEPEPNVAPTDSRNRPDQRLMENRDFDNANLEKLRLEEKQRTVRRQKEAEAEQAIQEGRPYKHHDPRWFRKQKDAQTGGLIHMYNGQYWSAKEKQEWSNCPDIY